MHWLSLSIWVPIAFGALLLALGREDQVKAVRWLALVGALAGLAVTLPLIQQFDNSTAAMQFVEKALWIERFNIHYGFGIDGIAALMIFLTTLLGFIVIIGSWHYVKDREMGFFISLLLLQTGMTGVFCATDLFLFYVFWEAMLVPM